MGEAAWLDFQTVIDTIPSLGRVRSPGRHRPSFCKSGSGMYGWTLRRGSFHCIRLSFRVATAMTVDFGLAFAAPPRIAQGRHNSLRHSLWAPSRCLRTSAVEATSNEPLALPFRHNNFRRFSARLPWRRSGPIRSAGRFLPFRPEGLVDGGEKSATDLPANVPWISAPHRARHSRRRLHIVSLEV